MAFSAYFHGAELREEVEEGLLPDAERTGIIGLIGVSPLGKKNELVLITSPKQAYEEFGDPDAIKEKGVSLTKAIAELDGKIKDLDTKIAAEADAAKKAALGEDKKKLEADRKTAVDTKAALGDPSEFTLSQAFTSIYAQTNALIVVLNVYADKAGGSDAGAPADGEGERDGTVTPAPAANSTAAPATDPRKALFDKYKDAVVGKQGAGTGLFKFIEARSKFDLEPDLLIAPEFSHDSQVLESMRLVANELSAVVLFDIDDAKTVEEAITIARNLTSSRLQPCYPRVYPESGDTANHLPLSSFLAGHIARTDRELGTSRSPSNRLINGIKDLSKVVRFSMKDENSDANRLNEVGITTMIRMKGWRVWGSRTVGKGDPIEEENKFINVRRTRDKLHAMVIQIAFQAIDDQIGINFISHVEDEMNEYMRLERSNQRLLGGTCKALAADNPVSQLKKGTVVFAVDSDIAPPAEQIKIKATITHKYLEQIFKQA